MRQVIALDVGGSSIKSALVSKDGKIVHELQTSLGAQKTPQGVVDLLARVIAEHRRAARNVIGVGIGCPGPLDPKRGIILFTPNLPFKKPFPLAATLKKRAYLPIVLQNDANVAVLGEGWLGAGRGASVVVMLTLGTGIGGGVLIDGKIFDGSSGQGTELGHMPLYGMEKKCGAGHPGCFEAYANSSAITEHGKKLFGASRVKEPLDLYRLAARGDQKARKYFEEYGRMLAVPVSYLINVFNPEVVIFGGAISGAWKFFAPTLKKEVYRWAFRSIAHQAKLKKATLGNRAGVFGAAKLGFDAFGHVK